MPISVDCTNVTAAVTAQKPVVTATVTIPDAASGGIDPAKNETDFLRRVLPWPKDGAPGVINMHWTSPGHNGMSGRPFSQLQDFLAMVKWCNTHPDAVKD